MKRYNVGDKVWVARAGHQDVTETCPVCFGKLSVMLTLGNGDTVTLPCNYCDKMYGSPQGVVTDVAWAQSAGLMTISGVDISQTASGEGVEYRSESYILYPCDIFDTEAEALARGQEIADKLAEERRTRTEHIKADAKKTFSWNAGYHLREAKRKEKEAERHRECAKVCKAKTDPPKITI